ncbi:MAG TPA: hypothetical protein VK550_10915 [Polyangiaceae bacterium]|nr:hypothetical protein [Polyangiaceae bacterium]
MVFATMLATACQPSSHVLYVLKGTFTPDQEEIIAGAEVWNADPSIAPKIDVAFGVERMDAGNFIILGVDDIAAVSPSGKAWALTDPWRHLISIDTKLLDGRGTTGMSDESTLRLMVLLWPDRAKPRAPGRLASSKDRR